MPLEFHFLAVWASLGLGFLISRVTPATRIERITMCNISVSFYYFPSGTVITGASLAKLLLSVLQRVHFEIGLLSLDFCNLAPHYQKLQDPTDLDNAVSLLAHSHHPNPGTGGAQIPQLEPGRHPCKVLYLWYLSLTATLRNQCHFFQLTDVKTGARRAGVEVGRMALFLNCHHRCFPFPWEKRDRPL